MKKHFYTTLRNALLVAVGLGLAAQPALAETGQGLPQMTLYGFAHFATSYSTGATPVGNYGLYVESGSQDPDFNMTANFSRLGLSVKGLDTETEAVNGKIEFDFYGGGSQAKALIRMRQAYVEMVLKSMDLSILAGQSWDIVSPLIPPTVNIGILWYTGNLGYRHPQFRITKGLGPVTVKLAAMRPMANVGDTGYKYETPMIQGSLGYALGKKGYIGVSGHYSQDETGEANAKTYNESHVISAELKLPLGDMLTLQAEAYKGTNAEIVMGGIGQGVVNGKSLNAKGAWASLSVAPFKGTSFNLYGGIDTAQDDQLDPGGRSQNTNVALNMITTVMEKVSLGLEVGQWNTQYKDAEDGQALRVDGSLKYAF